MLPRINSMFLYHKVWRHFSSATALSKTHQETNDEEKVYYVFFHLLTFCIFSSSCFSSPALSAMLLPLLFSFSKPKTWLSKNVKSTALTLLLLRLLYTRRATTFIFICKQHVTHALATFKLPSNNTSWLAFYGWELSIMTLHVYCCRWESE